MSVEAHREHLKLHYSFPARVAIDTEKKYPYDCFVMTNNLKIAC